MPLRLIPKPMRKASVTQYNANHTLIWLFPMPIRLTPQKRARFKKQWGIFQFRTDSLKSQRDSKARASFQCQPDSNEKLMQNYPESPKSQWDSSQCQWDSKARASSQCQPDSNETLMPTRLTPTVHGTQCKANWNHPKTTKAPKSQVNSPQSQQDSPQSDSPEIQSPKSLKAIVSSQTQVFSFYSNNVMRILKCCCNTGCLISSDLFHQ